MVSIQRKNPQIKDYQGNIIRHVRIRTKAGKEVKERINYLSKHDYKNKFYSEAGSIPYAILFQQFTSEGIKREMVPIASFEIAKMRKETGKFDIEKYIQKFHPENKDWNIELLKVGQKVIILKDDNDYEKRNNNEFQKNRLYVITQFSEGSIWLKYHLEAREDGDIDKSVKEDKDKLLWKYEKELGLPEVLEDMSNENIQSRKKDFEDKKYKFSSFNDFRINRILKLVGKEKIQLIMKELSQYKKQFSTIEFEGKTPLLKMSKENWNFLLEGKDFEMQTDGTLIFKE